MKKIISLILAIIMLLGVFALTGCEGDDVRTDNGTNANEGNNENTGENNNENNENDETQGEENGEQGAENVDTTPQLKDPTKYYRILFIGNSFTYHNSMPQYLFYPLCKKAGYSLTVDAITNSGHYLWEFASETDEYGARIREALSTKKYDAVVIQEQSGNPVSNPSSFYAAARKLAKLVKDHGAELWYYQTWGYKEGYSKLPTHGGTTENMEMKLRAAYTAIAEETGGKVVHAGVAMLDVHKNTDINVYNDDGFHPSREGSMLVAYTMLAEIFGVDPRTIDYNGSLSEEVATQLKEAAYRAAFEDNSVDEAYKTSSVGK